MTKESKRSFTSEDLEMIRETAHNLIVSLSKELESPELPVLFSVWDFANLALRKVNADHPDFEIQKTMDNLNICHSKLLKDPGAIKDD